MRFLSTYVRPCASPHCIVQATAACPWGLWTWRSCSVCIGLQGIFGCWDIHAYTVYIRICTCTHVCVYTYKLIYLFACEHVDLIMVSSMFSFISRLCYVMLWCITLPFLLYYFSMACYVILSDITFR